MKNAMEETFGEIKEAALKDFETCGLGELPKEALGQSTHDLLKQFEVKITETLRLTVIVEAENQYEAERIASIHWQNSKYILNAENFVDVEFVADPLD